MNQFLQRGNDPATMSQSEKARQHVFQQPKKEQQRKTGDGVSAIAVFLVCVQAVLLIFISTPDGGLIIVTASIFNDISTVGASYGACDRSIAHCSGAFRCKWWLPGNKKPVGCDPMWNGCTAPVADKTEGI